jgi:hypothetical protein
MIMTLLCLVLAPLPLPFLHGSKLSTNFKFLNIFFCAREFETNTGTFFSPDILSLEHCLHLIRLGID